MNYKKILGAFQGLLLGITALFLIECPSKRTLLHILLLLPALLMIGLELEYPGSDPVDQQKDFGK